MADDRSTNPLPTLAARLERTRKDAGMSLDVLAERSGLARTEVQRVLAGGDAGISVLVRLAGTLEVDPVQLLDGLAWVPDDGGGRFEIEEPEGG